MQSMDWDHFTCTCNPVVPTPFVIKIILSPLNWLGTVVKSQFYKSICGLCPILLTYYFSVFALVHCHVSCRFIVLGSGSIPFLMTGHNVRTKKIGALWWRGPENTVATPYISLAKVRIGPGDQGKLKSQGGVKQSQPQSGRRL